MEINTTTTRNPFSASQISFRITSASGKTPSPEPAVVTDTREQLIFTRKQVQKLLKALQSISTPLPTTHLLRTGGSGIQAATTSSSMDLGLTTTAATSTVLQSTEEVNTASTSFSPFGPSFTGSSTSLATIGGIYDGDNGTDTLTFTVTTGGVVSVSPILALEVRDSQDQLVEQITLNLYQADDIYTLQNGLELSLSSGTLTTNDTFTVDVSDSTGSSINPDAPFNGTRNNNPNFDNGLSVSAGSFDVNGTSITVNADDTLNNVITTINQSSAGVTATFDSDTETVVLTQTTAGATPTITVENDTSGFLSATKLSSATAVQGQDEIQDEDRVLSEVAKFSSVTSGSILINSVSVSLNVLTDSLNDMLSRINNSAANVTVSFNGTRQRISITANDSEDQLVLDSNGTGFFTALEITDGTYEQSQGTAISNTLRKGVSPHRAAEFVRALRDVGEALNPLFDNRHLQGDPGPFLNQLRADFQSTIADIFGVDGPRFRSKFGIQFDFSPSSNKVFNLRLSGIEHNLLTNTLRENPTRANQLLFGSPTAEDDGLIESVVTVLEKAEKDLRDKLGDSGTVIDIFV